MSGAYVGDAKFYERYRPDVPPSAAELLVAQANRDGPATRLLDLGTGTGQVVRALQDNFPQVIAIDPDAEMIAEARRVHQPPPGGSVEFVVGRAEEYRPPVGWHPDLVTACRAFHWMDQAAVLRWLAEWVSPTGCVAIMGGYSLWASEAPWLVATREVVRRYVDHERRPGDAPPKPGDPAYRDILKESRFSDIEEFALPLRRTWTVDGILGYLYSTSFAAPYLFGEKRASFEHALRNELSMYGDADGFVEDTHFFLRIARVPK